MSRGNYKLCPNCRALSILALTVSIGLFSEYLLDVRRAKHARDVFPNQSGLFNVREFVINVSDQLLNETFLKLREHSMLPLKHRPNRRHSKLLQEIVDYWQNKYEWRKREAYFNKYPNYKTTVRGLDVHFIHISATNTTGSFPIILLHGWPGSFKDFYPLIPLLRNENFTLVIPSLIGCAFSRNDYVGGSQQGVVFNELMQKLGYEKYYVYGHDWGSFIGTEMAIMYPENVMGLYSPFCLSLRRISLFKYFIESTIPDFFIGKETKSKYSLIESLNLIWNDAGILRLYLMKPELVGIQFSDYPASLANYILNIIQSLTYAESTISAELNLTEIYGFDNLIDTIMLYLVTNTAESAVDTMNDIANDYKISYQIPIKAVPVACPKFLGSIFYQSDWILRDKFNYIVSRRTFSAKHFYLIEEDPSFLREHTDDIKKSIEEMARIKNFNRTKFQ